MPDWLFKERYRDIIHHMDKSSTRKTFSERVKLILKYIPPGKIISYGTVAALAGSPRAARQVVQILHRTDNIPWHRVVNSHGVIAIKDSDGFQEQKMLLSMEGVESDQAGKIEPDKYQWKINSIDELIEQDK